LSTYLRQATEKIWQAIRAIPGVGRMAGCRIKRVAQEQFNKNIYTRILFTNVILFVIVLTALSTLSNFAVKRATYDQVQQELLRKAKRVNFALLQQPDQKWSASPNERAGDKTGDRQETLKLLADIFDTKITVFDIDGNIVGTSAEQELVPGSKVDEKYIKTIKSGETKTSRTVDQETGQPVFVVTIPMGNSKDKIENGIMLEAKPANLDLALSKNRLHLVIGGIVALVVIIFVSVYLALHISRPISRLATTVTEISRGSFVLSDEDQPLDEINVLTSQLNKLTIRMQEIQAESRRIDSERARLFAETSHELRTPLTAVQGFVEAIRDGMVQDEVLMKKYLDTIYTQTVHITRLVDDIMILSRLESGNITVEKLPLDLTALANGVATSMEAVAASRNTTILMEKGPEKAIVIGDVDRMEQIIRNLLKNAIMATEDGNITVGIEAGADEVVLTVKDDGIGIPPEDLPHIWDRFYRVKNRRDNSMQGKGSGLGLVIVKKLVQLQNGSIDVDSQLGKGTTFSIRFPSFNKG
jgi:signal transduction histidine kinase